MSANVTLYVCNHNTIRLQFNHAGLPDRSCDLKKLPRRRDAGAMWCTSSMS